MVTTLGQKEEVFLNKADQKGALCIKLTYTRFTGGIHAGRSTNQEYSYTRTWQ